MTRIKICGITNLDDAMSAVELGVDALGFVFSESPRKISIEDVEKITENLPPFVVTVGVFVNEYPEFIAKVFLRCKIDAFQLHGDETPNYCTNFPNEKIIKAFRLKDRDSINLISKYKEIDAILLDVYVEGKYGGTGETFNWDLAIEAKKFGKPIILSGGLNPENVKDAILKVKPYAVDTSSGVEEKPGKKDFQKMKEFVRRVRDTQLK